MLHQVPVYIESSRSAATTTSVLQQCATEKFCCGTHSFQRAVKGKMRLSGRQIRLCAGAAARYFPGLDFEAAAGEALAVTGPNGSGKTSLLRLIAGLLAAAGGSVALEGGAARTDPARTGPLSRPSRRAEAGAERARKPVVLAGVSRRRAGRSRANVSKRWASITPCICRRRICRPASGGGSRSRACSWCGGRSGCWTNRPRRSMRPGRIYSPA